MTWIGSGRAMSLTRSKSPFSSAASISLRTISRMWGSRWTTRRAVNAVLDDLAVRGVLRRVHVDHHLARDRNRQGLLADHRPAQPRGERLGVLGNGSDVLVADHRPEARLVGNRVPPQWRLATHPLEQGVRRALSEQIGIAQIDLGEIDGLFTGQRHCDTSQTSREKWRAYINAPQPMRGAADRNVGASLAAGRDLTVRSGAGDA